LKLINIEEHRKSETSYICHKGCKQYGRVQNVKKGILEEFCWAGEHSRLIKKKVNCDKFESKYPVLPEGVLGF
jgi:hypothetical protein